MNTPPHARPGRARSRALVVSAIVVALLGVVGVVAGVISYVHGHQDKGTPPSGVIPPDTCQLSEQTLQRARTSNPRYFTESDSGGEKYSLCNWAQTKGKDSIDTRGLGYLIHRYTGPDAEKDVRTGFANAKMQPHSVQPAQIKDAPGISDEAAYQTAIGGGGKTSVTLVARKATTMIEVTYQGADQGFFWTTPMSATEGEKITKIVALELLSRP